jgi:trehalose-6-phosphatase
MLAAGDDLTDEDLFDALPESSIAIHVGPPRPRGRNGFGHTRFTVESPEALRRALLRLAGELSDEGADTQLSRAARAAATT